MGLFSRKPTLPDPARFYAISCEKFHNMANEGLELTPNGLILVPELLEIGQKVILALLQDPSLQRRCGTNPETYYYVITAHSFDAGLVFGDRWHNNVSSLKSGFVDEVIKGDINEYSNPIIENIIGWDDYTRAPFYKDLFDCWKELHAPYWKLRDPREYTFSLMLAAYQLGVSVILTQYGF